MFLLQNVYTSKESATDIVSSKMFQTLKAAIKERDDAVEDAIVNHYGDYDENSIDVQENINSKCICGPDFIDVWFITNLDDVDNDDLGTDYPIVEVNPEDDIKYVFEESGAYDKEIKKLTANGTYEKFLAEVENHIDWDNVGDSMREVENDAIARAVDEVLGACENNITNCQLAAEIVDVLDEYLDDKGIVIPCASESEEEDRKESDSCCALYGSEYWNLVDFLESALNDRTLSEDEIASQLLEKFESLLKSKNIDLQAFKEEYEDLHTSISSIIS